MPKFDKYKPSPKVLKPGPDTGHLTPEQERYVIENPREQGETWQGYKSAWARIPGRSYAMAIYECTTSGAASVCHHITSYFTDKPPKR